MWKKCGTRDELYAAFEWVKAQPFSWIDYISGEEQFQGPGWYWIEMRVYKYFNRTRDNVLVAIPADVRVREIKEKVKELTDLLVEARRATKT